MKSHGLNLSHWNTLGALTHQIRRLTSLRLLCCEEAQTIGKVLVNSPK